MSAKEVDTILQDNYLNLDELSGHPPLDNHDSLRTRSDDQLRGSPTEEIDHAGQHPEAGYKNLDELMNSASVENSQENSTYQHFDLEEAQTNELPQHSISLPPAVAPVSGTTKHEPYGIRFVKVQNHLYVTSYLIGFSILGTLARLGLQAITIYPGAPVVFSELWANVGGSLIMGFLSEDRSMFNKEWKDAVSKARQRQPQEANSPSIDRDEKEIDEAVIIAAVKVHKTAKKSIPMFIGLSVGFCGSFTSFSSFIRDAFLSLSNELNTSVYSDTKTSGNSQVPRNPGDSVMGVLAIVIIEVCVCLSALECGAHVAIALQPVLSKLPNMNKRIVLDPLAVFVGWGLWIGSVILAIWPPDRSLILAARERSPPGQDKWRGHILFALIFAPLGCLLRFHTALLLNGLISWFPLGTFAVNLGGTMVLGACWDLQHVRLANGMVGGGRVGCQVLQGIQDGFCGCLTTVSTWVMELKGLRRKHAYFYGAMSVGLGLTTLVVIMGTVIWTHGVSEPICST